MMMKTKNLFPSRGMNWYSMFKIYDRLKRLRRPVLIENLIFFSLFLANLQVRKFQKGLVCHLM